MSVPNHSNGQGGNIGHGKTDPDGDLDLDLAALAAVEGAGTLTPADSNDLDAALVADFEAAAGAVFLALGAGDSSPPRPPVGFEQRLERSVLARAGMPVPAEDGVIPSRAPGADPAVSSPKHVERHGHSQARTRKPALVPVPAESIPAEAGSSWGPMLAAGAGWLAAAGLLFVLVLSKTGAAGDSGPEDQQVALLRKELLDTVPDVQILPWASSDTGGPKGDVAWSDVRNEGYMRIAGLQPNDPTKSQYQLWIFRGTDPGAEPHPVDGGVFDVTPGGEVIVPINAKLDVGRAGLFAVTVEKPGGVVVSEREQIVLLAARPG